MNLKPSFHEYRERLRSVLRGFHFLGPRWTKAALSYLAHPLLRRIFRGKSIDCGGYCARIGECDLFVLGNLFREYDAAFLRRVLPDVERVIDAGANVGAFSFLVHQLQPRMEIVAIEPDTRNFAHLRSQPFAGAIDCRHAALGAKEGFCKLVEGGNSATHHTEAIESGRPGTMVPCLALDAFPPRKTLLKLDIEGAELALLKAPLPEWIDAVVMEWHFPDLDPQPLFPGGSLVRTADNGQCWSWRRDQRTSAQEPAPAP